MRHASRGKGCDAPPIFIFFLYDLEKKASRRAAEKRRTPPLPLLLCVSFQD